MLPHPGTPRFLTLILSAEPLSRVLRTTATDDPSLSLSSKAFQSRVPKPLSNPEDRSLTRYPLSPASLFTNPKGMERAKNLNSFLGLLIPRIDAEFRAPPFAPIPSFSFHSRPPPLLVCSPFRVFVRPSRSPPLSSRERRRGTSWKICGIDRHRPRLGWNYDHRSSE